MCRWTISWSLTRLIIGTVPNQHLHGTFSSPILVDPFSCRRARRCHWESPVAALVYQHDQSIVSLFCWPPNRGCSLKHNNLIQGCNVHTWGNSARNYIVVYKLDN